jgi:proline dehydrogenase
MQDAADDLVTNMMRKYNKDKPYCFTNYCKCTVGIDWLLKGLHPNAKEEGFHWMKLVRCLIWKRNYEQKKKISYTNIASKEATDNYDAAVL